MKKRLILLIMLISMALSTGATSTSSYITDSKKLSGADYTDIPALAEALNDVFAGNPAMYSDVHCTKKAAALIGSRDVPLGTAYYVKNLSGSVYSGTSCYIYANAVYSRLFGDVPYHGDNANWQNSERVIKNAASASYELFSKNGVRCGALLRTTSNSDGSYNGNKGHSVIILKYNESTVTYLEGNGDGKGLIRVTERSWETFNSVSVSGRGYRISFVVQPTADYYDSLLTGIENNPTDYVGYFVKSKSYDGRFQDVKSSKWYYSGIKSMYELGLMEGRSGSAFDPNGTVTAAESVTMASRFLSLYWADGHRFSESGGHWYDTYYDYCALWGIDTGFAKPSAAVTRAQFAALMYRALPSGARTSNVSVGSIPDVPNGASYSDAVYALYRSGILEGDGGLFRPNGTLTRAEAAVLLSRMADRSLRLG